MTLFRFIPNYCDSSISDSITWNRIKSCMQYTYFKRWHWYNFCGRESKPESIKNCKTKRKLTYTITVWNCFSMITVIQWAIMQKSTGLFTQSESQLNNIRKKEKYILINNEREQKCNIQIMNFESAILRLYTSKEHS